MLRSTAERQAIALMKMHGLWDKGWRFGWMSAKKTLGICYFGRKEIKLSTVYVDANSPEKVGETVLHEIAHALAGAKAGHGPEWRRICLAIGGTGERCGESEAVLEYAWHGTCGQCGKVTKQHRAPLRVKACGTCVDAWLPENVLVWRQHGRKVPVTQMPRRYMAEALRLAQRYPGRLPI